MKKVLVRNLNTLKMLERNGFITLHSHTGTIVRGHVGYISCYYIDTYKSSRFIHKGVEYIAEFVSGCFFPYVFKISC